MRIDTSGNVGIGTSSPATKLQVVGGNVLLDNNQSYQIKDVGGTARAVMVLSSADELNIQNNSGGDGGAILFNTKTAGAESMRIDSNGDLLVGTTINYGSAKTHINSAGTVLSLYCSGGSGSPGIIIGKASNDASTSQVLMQFLYNSGSLGLGQINGNGSGSAAFGSYSDIRLKENITNVPSQLEKICALRPVEFDYKDGSGHQTGFIAQEIQEVYPEAVAVGQNEMLTVTGWNKTEAYLVKAIQEQQAIIQDLKARIAALEAK
jgi:hypothetical protein